MKIDNAQALTTQSFPFVGKEAMLSAKSNASDAAVAASERDTQVASSQPTGRNSHLKPW
jgi:hypothetical protein